MNKLKWCCEQKKGIELIEPNDNLCEAYFKEARETLEAISDKENKWNVIMAYYAAYNAFYALLMKAGMKCEQLSENLNITELRRQIDEYNK